MAKVPTALEKIKELDAQRQALIDDAKEEALARAKEAIEDLNALGFDYRLVSGSSAAGKGRPSKQQTRASAEGPCNICGFTTDPAHDGRRHRSQGDKKRPFNDAELGELGMVKVD